MRGLAIPLLLALSLAAACASHRELASQATLAELRNVSPDVRESPVDQGLDEAMLAYRRFLEETPETAMTPEAMRRLADLQIEKQFGIHTGDTAPREMAAPAPAPAPPGGHMAPAAPTEEPGGAVPRETDQDFEARTTAPRDPTPADAPGDADPTAALEAIALYDRLLAEYPRYENSDMVLYQKARAYGELGRTEEAMATMDLLIRTNPHSKHYDEVQFRRGEYLFTRRHFREAESAYAAVVAMGDASSYYELALYKLGWALYKQEFYEEALHNFVALLDYKVSIGYDFDQAHAEEDERRVADTYRAISLSFSYLGGPEAVAEYFSTFGNRSYEARVYSNLGDHYRAKLRYDDAAKTYRAFESLYPTHREAPRFSMRVVETFTEGGFPKLVLEAKRDFADRYGLQADYWRHFAPEESPEVLAYLKANLKDLATHYHAQYQGTEIAEDKPSHYREALRWYHDYLDSFPTDPDSPPINYRLADLHLENEDFGEAAREYERTAYEYELHPQSAAAGYAAVYAYRQQLGTVGEESQDEIKRETVASSLRFVDAFPGHEQAAAILGAAADDMYEMTDYDAALVSAQRLLATYPAAGAELRRSAWIVVAHSSFELAAYAQAENAYAQVLLVTPEEDESHADLVDNLAASIYKQGELASEAQDYRAAADHFLRIREAAPTSTIRASAEYDAGAALIHLEDWTAAAEVLERFRRDYPEHELQLDATRQIAYAYREAGRLSQAADEYERLASGSEDPELRAEALLVSGELYQQSQAPDRALDVYTRYVDEFPRPVEMALETRFKIAEIHKAAHDEPLYHQELEDIVRIDAEAGSERTGRTRTLAARSALVLAERLYQDCLDVRLLQPFEASLQEKQQRMDVAIEAMGQLVTYEISDVTAAATYYIAETYFDFSQALAESERPTDLQPIELLDYELALEEEAFPFEEKAIDLHEENLELLQAGVFNDWTEKSLGRLAELVPGRYAKNEMSSGFIAAIDIYVYRSPASLLPLPAVAEDESQAGAEPAAATQMPPPPADPAPAVEPSAIALVPPVAAAAPLKAEPSSTTTTPTRAAGAPPVPPAEEGSGHAPAAEEGH